MKMISAGVICFILLLGVARAEERAAKAFDIGAQSLSAALSEFARQSQREIVYTPKVVRDKKTAGVKGTMEALSALSTLLKNTGLTFSTTPAGAILVGDPQATAQGPDEGRRFAQTSQAMQKMEEPRISIGNSADPQAWSGSSRDSDRPADDRHSKGVPEILVRGARSANAGIRRTEDDVQPYVVFDADQIERSAAANIEEFLRIRLPMHTRSSTNAQLVNGGVGNVSSINLRGLGSNQTLVLVNGRRMPGIAAFTNSNSFEQPDLNGIPLSAVERIEVLPSTASGIYGGGATGGVLNVVLKQNFSGMEMGVTYENTFSSNADRQRLDLNGGFSFGGGRTALTFSASASQSGRLLAADRDFAQRGRQLYLDNDLASVLGSSEPPPGYTTNIRSANGQPLVLDSGEPLGSSFTSVPAGYAGTQSDGGLALLANAGRYNLDLPDDLSGSRQSLLYSPRVRSAMLGLHQQFGAGIEGFMDVAAYDNDSEADFVTGPGTIGLAADAPTNPFTTDIRVQFPLPGLIDSRSARSRTLRGTAGLTVPLWRDWSMQAEYNRSRARHESTATHMSSSTDLLAAMGSYGVAYLDPSLNPLRDLNRYLLDISGYRIAAPSEDNGPFDMDMENAVLRAAGSAAKLPAGPLRLALQVEYRDEQASGGYSRRLSYQTMFGGSPDGTRAALYYPQRWQRARAAYAEATVPLFSQGNARRGLSSLEAQISVRAEAYTTLAVPNGSIYVPDGSPMPPVEHARGKVKSTDWTFGLRYAPVESVALRASYGTGFLPPSIAQLFPTILPGLQSVWARDPQRGNVDGYVGPMTIVTGGNPNLGPELSTSWTAGVIYTPVALRGLRLSLDITNIEKRDEISAIGWQMLLDAESQLPGRIRRDPLTQEDIDRGYTAGPVTYFDASMVNLAGSRVRALDLKLDYRWPDVAGGMLHLFALGTFQDVFERQTTAASTPLSQVGYANAPLKRRGNAGLNWDRDAWSLGWSVQYYDSHWVYHAGASPAVVNSYIRRQGSTTIPRQLYHDLLLQYRFERAAGGLALLSGTQLTFGIQNVFDTAPPIVATTGTTGGYSLYGDPRLRRYSIALKKGFQ